MDPCNIFPFFLHPNRLRQHPRRRLLICYSNGSLGFRFFHSGSNKRILRQTPYNFVCSSYINSVLFYNAKIRSHTSNKPRHAIFKHLQNLEQCIYSFSHGFHFSISYNTSKFYRSLKKCFIQCFKIQIP